MEKLLSLCMIVKNEENVLRRCLDSVKDGVDEIIIVDTGSVDQTKKIARQFTEHIYDYKWKKDFSDARNFAQSKASGEWILVLDADEFVYIDNLKETRKQLKDQNVNYDAFDVKIFNFTGDQGQFTIQNCHTRIYKNLPEIKYYRAIHEQIYKNGEPLDAGLSCLILYHSGYLTYTVHEKNKRARNKELIDKEIKSNGQSGFDYFNLANEFSSAGNYELALENYIKAFNNKPAFAYSWVSYSVVQMINCLIRLKRFTDGLNVINDAKQLYSESPDFQTLKARIYLLQGRIEDAEEVLIKLINHTKQYKQTITSPDYLEFFPYKWIGIIYEEKHDVKKAIYYYSKAFKYNANDDELVKNYFSLLIQSTTVSQLEQFILDECMMDSETKAYRLLKVFLLTPKLHELANQLAKHCLIEDKGLALKLLIINGESNKAYSELQCLSLQHLIQIVNYGLFDFQDFVFLCLKKHDLKLLEDFKNIYPQSDKIINLMLNKISEFDEKYFNIYLSFLERTLVLSEFDVFEELLDIKKSFNVDINIKIGHLLYHYQFADLAVQFYQQAGNKHFDEQAYLNIIKEFKKQNMSREAFNFALEALNKGFTHFTLVEEVVEFTGETKDKAIQQQKYEIFKFVLNLFPDSSELQNLIIKAS